MTVKEMKDILKDVPDEEEITVIYPEMGYGEHTGLVVDSVACIRGTQRVHSGVYIKLGYKE